MTGNLAMGLPGVRIGGDRRKLNSMVNAKIAIYTGSAPK
jgi:hypothetical protein